MKKVTIMIPTYNQAQYIEECIESARMQDYPNLEIVISDDSTNDDTQKIIRDKYIDDFRIKYFRNKERLGRVGNYRHTLYEKATGDYVLNLDGDDYLTDSLYISQAVKILNENSDVICTIARISIYNMEENSFDEGKSAYSFFNKIDDGDKYLSFVAQRKVGFNHLTVVYRREEALKMDFYSINSTWTDSLSVFKLICGHKMAFFDKVVGTWRVHSSNESKKFHENISFEDVFFNDKHIASFCKKINAVAPNWLNISLYNNMKFYSLFLVTNKKWRLLISYMLYLLMYETYLSLLFIPKFIFFLIYKVVKKVIYTVFKKRLKYELK